MLCAPACQLYAVGQAVQWDLERTVTIGDAMDGETGLTRVGDVTIAGDRVLVGQPMERRVRVFSTRGEFIGFVGRQGAGPGEFEGLGRIGLLGDMFWVWDYHLNRIEYFSANYDHVSTLSLRGHPSVSASGLHLAGVLRDSSILARVMSSAAVAVSAPRAPEWLLRLDPKGFLRDSVAILRGIVPETEVIDGLQSDRRLYMTRPVFDRSLVAVWPDGSGFVVVDRESAAERVRHRYRVTKFDADADTVFRRDYPYEPIPISSAWLSRRVDQATGVHAGNRWGIVANRRRFRLAVREAFSDLEYFPAVAAVEAGPNGTTWLLRRIDEDSFEWEVLDTAGFPIGRFEEPPGARLAAAADLGGAWFHERDELDVPYIVRYEFRDR